MDWSILGHPTFLLFLGAQLGAAVALWALTEWLHGRARRRGVEHGVVRRSRLVCRGTILALFLSGTAVYLVPAYRPLLGEAKLRNAYTALERADGERARLLLSEAVEHLGAVADATEAPGIWATLVGRFVQPWGGRAAVLAALGSAHFLLGECDKAMPYLERELRARPDGARTALLSYRVAVCHAQEKRRRAAEDALLNALLIDRSYAGQAKRDPKLRRIAESLLAKRL